MIADEELARAIGGRPHWRADGEHGAVYQPPGAAGHVKLRRVAQPGRASDRWVISIIKGGRATRSLPCGTVAEAIKFGERAQLG